MADETVKPQTAPKKKSSPTPYHVLRLVDPRAATYELVGPSYTAHNSDQAVRDYVQTAGAVEERGGTYVAVPSRSFKHVTVAVETTTKIKIEEA